MTPVLRSNRPRALPLSRLPEVLAVIVILIAAITVFAVSAPGFFELSNMSTIIQQGAMLAIATMGMALVILIAEIDLSIGSVMAMAGVTTGLALVAGWGVLLSVLAGLAVGVLAGVINGFIVVTTGLHSFVVTFGMLGMARGLALVVTESYSVTGFPDSFGALLQSVTLGIPFAFWMVLIVVVITYFLLHRTSFGSSLYAIGSGVEIARLAGIRVAHTKWIVFALSGAFAALAGIMVVARLNAAHPGSGSGYEFDAIAACVVGGVPLEGRPRYRPRCADGRVRDHHPAQRHEHHGHRPVLAARRNRPGVHPGLRHAVPAE